MSGEEKRSTEKAGRREDRSKGLSCSCLKYKQPRAIIKNAGLLTRQR